IPPDGVPALVSPRAGAADGHGVPGEAELFRRLLPALPRRVRAEPTRRGHPPDRGVSRVQRGRAASVHGRGGTARHRGLGFNPLRFWPAFWTGTGAAPLPEEDLPARKSEEDPGEVSSAQVPADLSRALPVRPASRRFLYR